MSKELITISKKNHQKKTLTELANDQPFLLPIEKPEDKELQEIYKSLESYFGKVMTPMKVFSARMPAKFNKFYQQIGALDEDLTLPRETSMLIRELVAKINVCLFCIDSNQIASIQANMNQDKFNAILDYQTSSLFTDSEKAAFNYASELARNKKMDIKTFAELTKYYTETQICEIVYLVASEHIYNITNIGLNIHSDNLCQI